jgi:hypothetical protein
MCTNPGTLKLTHREPVLVQCRKCDACIAARKRHWIGRLIAEQATATSVFFVTLTYGGGYENEDYSDVQKLFKRMRKAGHKFKYLCVGEYGGERGRAHWHVLFYFQGKHPDWEALDKRINWDMWPNGFTQAEKPRSTQAASVYLMDYMSKQNLAGAELKYSKVPQLGEEYLLNWARKHAQHGLPLFANGKNTFTVDIEGQTARNGKSFYYPIGRDEAMYLKLLRAWFREWVKTRPDQPLALSDDVKEYLSDICQDVEKLEPEEQDFVARHYGYQPCHEGKVVYSTTYTVDSDLTLEVGSDIVLRFHDEKGVLTKWVLKDDVLKQRKVRRITKPVQQLLDKALQELEPQITRLRSNVTRNLSGSYNDREKNGNRKHRKSQRFRRPRNVL